ncbi:hypothetical protein CEE39_08030 [bacterium (candidate division B38) B3_B38]|nr:MAG: hypothetical protein CEE39_08030 [bacterium (candidate division B38) B3_B38]
MPRLVLDAGNFSWLNSAVSRIKTRYLIQGMNYMQVEVANLGWNELGRDIAYFGEMQQEAQFPFISANILTSDSSAPLVKSSIIKKFSSQAHENAPGREMRVGILGLCADTEQFHLPPSLFPKAKILPPEKVISQALGDLKKSCQLIILLAALSLEEARVLCRNHQEIDIVLGAFAGASTPSPWREGNTIICYSGKDGEMIGELRLFLDEELRISSYISRLVPLLEDVGEDKKMKQLMEAANEEISEVIKKAVNPSKKGIK